MLSEDYEETCQVTLMRLLMWMEEGIGTDPAVSLLVIL